MHNKLPRIDRTRSSGTASIILNYNSASDVCRLVVQLLSQHATEHTVIIVDNASEQDDFNNLRSWLHVRYPEMPCGSTESTLRSVTDGELRGTHPKLLLIRNTKNYGYSGGNNVGIRIALALGVCYVLIVNPDIHIAELSYIATLTAALRADINAAVAASRVVNSAGIDQNPLREAAFLEEWLWPVAALRRNPYVLRVNAERVIRVPKVSGCCMMLSARFLRRAGLLDENVFLYSEEPILSHRVSAAGMSILYVPTVTAVHQHDAPTKGDMTLHSMRQFVRSRRYYLRTYSAFNWVQLFLLYISYDMLVLAHALRDAIRNIRRVVRWR